MSAVSEALQKTADTLTEVLPSMLPPEETESTVLFSAMRYSLCAGGKRIRPFLVLTFSSLFGGDEATAMRFACGVEMIHTYSLIHDDLPCMDNDALRRGQPTCHIAFGEPYALLAGDALLTHAFSLFSAKDNLPEAAAAAARFAACYSGAAGMIGGQVIDLLSENQAIPIARLRLLQAKKTGALLRLSCALGCICAGAYDESDPRMKAALAYADGIGGAFQIIDDILDAYSTTEVLGKPVGSDEKNTKTTYLTYFSREEAFALAEEYTENAKRAIAPFEQNGILCALADELLHRNH